jgi:hypothetical protein
MSAVSWASYTNPATSPVFLFLSKRQFLQRAVLVWATIMLGTCFATAQQGNAALSYNRFQYHSYSWQSFHTDAFHIYFPKGYDSLCAFTARELPGIRSLLQQRMTMELDKSPHIILYPATDQLYETNIGSHEPVSYTLPTVVLRGNRLIVAYEGSYEAMRGQLTEAMARAVWEEQFENGIGEQLKGTLIHDDKIPGWCKEGMIHWFAGGWTIEQEDQLQRNFAQPGFESWQEVIGYQPKLSGAAFCYYLTRRYYPQAVLQLYQQLRKKKDLIRAIRLITKKTLPETMSDCFAFYKKRFQIKGSPLLTRTDWDSSIIRLKHPKGVLKKLEVSADGKKAAYVIYSNKQRAIYISDLASIETVRLTSYKLPPWFGELSKDVYPLIQWKKDKQELGVIYPAKGSFVLKTYSATGVESDEHTLKHVDGIRSMDFYDEHQLLLAAYRNGQSDIVVYDPRKSRYRAITSDHDDDDDPVMDQRSGDVFFLSKRPLKKEHNDVSINKDSFYRAQGIFHSSNLKQPLVTDTLPYIRWNQPRLLHDGSILATHTRYGQERFAYFNTAGGFKTLLRYQPLSYSSKSNLFHFYSSKGDSIYLKTVAAEDWTIQQDSLPADTVSSWLMDYRSDAALRAKEDSILKAAQMNGGTSFLEGVLKPKNSGELGQQRKDSIHQSLQYDVARMQPYVLQLHSAYFTARVNNDYFINRYQPYQSYQGQFKFPEVGGMVQGGFTDLFEDHHFNIGYRLPAGTEGSDFFVYYQNTKKKTDWGIRYFRKVETLQPDPKRDWEDENGNEYPNTAKVKTHYYELSLHHPLSYYASIDFNTALRKDRTVFLATEKYSLHFAPVKAAWSINTLSYQYNKLQPTLPMLHRGFSSKAVLDVFAGLQGVAKDALYGTSIHLQYHQPVYKYITAVLGLKAGHSGGKQKLLYNMGGVDHNLTVRTDSSVHFSQDAPYAFQTLVTPLRGFPQNSLYGNQYALLNADVYFPVFQTLVPIETNFTSINQLQLGLFSDVAYARESWRPHATGQSKVAYGLSARTLLAGYAVRVDATLPNSNSRKMGWCLSISQ